MYSSLCLWCMKRRVYSYRDRPLAGSLMGYGPQLHLFRCISLSWIGSTVSRETLQRGGNGRGDGLKDSDDHRWFHGCYSSTYLKIKPHQSSSREGGGCKKLRNDKRLQGHEPRKRGPTARTCRGFPEDAAVSNMIIFLTGTEWQCGRFLWLFHPRRESLHIK